MFLLLFVVHNCRNEATYITESDFFYKHFFICNTKLCINQAMNVTKSDFFDFFIFWIFQCFYSYERLMLIQFTIVEMKK